MRKSEELLKCGKTHGSASTDRCDFCCGKTAAATRLRVAAAFVVIAWVHPLCTDSADDDDPQRQLNIAYRSGQVIR